MSSRSGFAARDLGVGNRVTRPEVPPSYARSGRHCLTPPRESDRLTRRGHENARPRAARREPVVVYRGSRVPVARRPPLEAGRMPKRPAAGVNSGGRIGVTVVDTKHVGPPEESLMKKTALAALCVLAFAA